MSAYNKRQKRYKKGNYRSKPSSSSTPTNTSRTPASAGPRRDRTSFGVTMVRMLLPFLLMLGIAGYLVTNFDTEKLKIVEPSQPERIVETETPEINTETEIDTEVETETEIDTETEVNAETEIETTIETETTDEIFQKVEEMPRFAGCEEMGGTMDEKKSCADKKMLRYVYDNIQYPAEAREKGIQGLVVIGLTIDEEGRVTDTEVVREPPEGNLGAAALRVVNDMPRWIPGKHEGKVVKVSYKLPVRFELE